MYKITEEINGKEVEVFKISQDSNGNPRYVIEDFYFLNNSPKLRSKLNLVKYRGKDFRLAYVFSSYNIKSCLTWFQKEGAI